MVKIWHLVPCLIGIRMTGIGWVADIGLWRFLCFRKADVGKRTFVRGPDPLVVRAGHCERQILIGSAHHYVRVGITLTVVLPETDGANLIGSPFTNGAIAAARARVKRRDGRVHGVSIRWRLMSASGAVANRPLFLPQTDWRLLGIFLGSRAHERRERVGSGHWHCRHSRSICNRPIVLSCQLSKFSSALFSHGIQPGKARICADCGASAPRDVSQCPI